MNKGWEVSMFDDYIYLILLSLITLKSYVIESHLCY